MKVKNIDLINYNSILSNFIEKRLPQRISFAITKNKIVIEKELEAYKKSLDKIVGGYEEFFVRNENGEVQTLSIGVPEVDVDHMDSYIKDIDELLSIEQDIDLYFLEESAFDYEDSDRYDAMSAMDIFSLQAVLCKNIDK